MRILLILVIASLAGLVGAAAQEAKPGSGRYAVEPSMDGFVRLDTTTGAVSHCSRRDGVWHCEVLAEDAGALSAEVKALSAEVARLTKEVAELRSRLEAQAQPQKPTAAAPALSPEEQEMEEALGFAEKLMRRFFGLVREMKRESANPI